MVGGFAVLVAAAIVATTPASSVDEALYTDGQPAPVTAPTVATTLPELSKLAESAMPAVVGVVTTQAAPPAVGDDALRELFERLHESPRKGIGSGFVIHRDGWIITNAHVVEGAERVEVDLGGAEPALTAKVVGTDAESDIALLKVEGKRALTPVPLGDSDRLSIAEWVLVIGSPFGLDHSVTVGIVSHVGRSDISPVGRPGYYDFIQTDASINPGNSGGPVLNLRGEVIGIATAVNATGQGIGFAIPINMAKGIVAQLKQHGRVVRSWLGVAVREPEDARPGVAPGVMVTEVSAGGPAEVAGVRVGDTIVAIEGHSVNSPARLRWYVSTAGVGRRIEVKVRRGEDDRTLRAQLGEVPPAEQARAEARTLLGEE
jgi:serine protease Do